MTDTMGRLRAATSYYDASYPPGILGGTPPPTAAAVLSSLNPNTSVADVPTTVRCIGTGIHKTAKVYAGGPPGTAQKTTWVSDTEVTYVAENSLVGHSTVAIVQGGFRSNELDLQVTAAEMDTQTEPPPPPDPPLAAGDDDSPQRIQPRRRRKAEDGVVPDDH